MKKIISLIIVIAIIILGLIIILSKSGGDGIPKNDTDKQITSNVTDSATTTNTTASTTVKTYKISDIAMHKDSKDCWTTIGGEVFDLTAWIKQHPGGDKAILSICGIDGTKAFEGQHGGKAKIEMKLETFKIGNLSK